MPPEWHNHENKNCYISGLIRGPIKKFSAGPNSVQNKIKIVFDSYSTIRYDTIEEFNVDSKAEYSALSSTRNQKKKLKQTTLVPL